MRPKRAGEPQMAYRNPNQHEGVEEEIEDLQHKIQVLEGDRKTTFEQTQSLIRQNREALQRGKMENRELRIALAQIQKDAGAAGTEDAETAKLTDLCAELRKCYDDLRNDAAEKCDELEEQADGLRDLERESEKPNEGDSPVTRQIRTLENRLDKAMIKYNEAQSIRRTYEQIVKRLKEERIGFDNQLAAVERTLKAKDHDLEELTLMLHDATHSKEQAKTELARLEDQLLEERKHRDEELKAKRKIAEQRAEMAKRLVEREQARQDIQKEAAGDLDQEGEAQLQQSVVTNILHHNLNNKTLEEEEQQIDRYEEAFRKIKDATGVSDINGEPLLIILASSRSSCSSRRSRHCTAAAAVARTRAPNVSAFGAALCSKLLLCGGGGGGGGGGDGVGNVGLRWARFPSQSKLLLLRATPA